MKAIKKFLLALMVASIASFPVASLADEETPDAGDGTETTEPVEDVDMGDTEEDKTEEKKTETKDESSKKSDSSSSGSKTSDSKKTTEAETKTDESYTKTYGSSIESGTIAIAFTSDMHDHIDSRKVTVGGKTSGVGGFAVLTTALRTNFEYNYDENVFLFDAGDFSVGSGYQTLFSTEAPELRLMGAMDYDAVTLGASELGFGTAALADMLEAARDESTSSQRKHLPQIVFSNIDWEKTLADPNKKKGAKQLKSAMKEYGVKDYTVIEKNGAKVAVFSVLGQASIEDAEECGLYFSDPIESAEKTLAAIKKEKDIDLVVCLSRCGIGTDEKNYEKSDEAKLAEEVEGIDLIISGYSHAELKDEIKVGKTRIVSCGCNTEKLGKVEYKKDEDSGNYRFEKYSLYSVKESKYTEDTEIAEEVEKFRDDVNSSYFSKYGLSMDSLLLTNKYQFTPIDSFGTSPEEDTLGNLIADSYRYCVKDNEGKDYKTVDLAAVSAAVVNESVAEGTVTASDAFNILSKGQGFDGSAGYPLCSLYLTGKELKSLVEIDASLASQSKDSRLYFAGIRYTTCDSRLKYNRSYDISLLAEDGTEKEISNNETYRVVCDSYTLDAIYAAAKQSRKMISLVPKDKYNYKVAEDNTDSLVLKKGNSELKAWYAVACYMKSFKSDRMSSDYKETDGRKIIDSEGGFGTFFKQPHRIMKLIYAGAILVLLIAALVVVLVAGVIGGRRRNSFGSLNGGGKKPKKEKTRFTPEANMTERQKRNLLNGPTSQRNLFSKRRHTGVSLSSKLKKRRRRGRF